MSTLHDVARETGTSVSTVSRVLSGGAAAARISDETSRRVTEAARRLGYRPNLLARSLRTRKSHTIALLVSDIANPWFAMLASRVEQILHQRGYSLLLCNSGEEPRLEEEYLRLLPDKGIDGLILVPTLERSAAIASLIERRIPLVALDRPIEGIKAQVATDERQLTKLLCDELKRAGVRKLGVLSGPLNIANHRVRCQNVSTAFEVVWRHEGRAEHQTATAAVESMHRFGPVDAIVCSNYVLGEGLLAALPPAGNTPIIGCFDELPAMNLLPIPIVCSVQDIPALAEAAAEQLLNQIRGDSPVQSVMLAGRIVANSSFKKLAQ